MNRLLLAMTGRAIGKRLGLIVMSLLLLAGYHLALTPAPARAAACVPPSADYGAATSTVNISTPGTYQIWSNLMAPDATNNSYLLELDGNTCYTVGDNPIAPNTWTWVDYHNATPSSKIRLNLNAGNHTVKMIGREAGVKLARVLLVSDLNCVPTGNGDNCAIAGDVEAPGVDLTAPAANATISSVVNMAAAANDNVGVAKVEFFVNGVLKSTDTAAPYVYSWDSKTVPNGPVSLAAKAYDVAGNSNSDTVQVQAANGDTQAPSVPGGASGKADASSKVTVKWSASTDNTAVAGYRVFRDGVLLAQVTSGTEYVDNSVLAATSYSYQVSAYDAAGNNSVPSGAVRVKTPNLVVPDTQPPAAPAGLSASAISAGQVNLKWSASTDNVGVAMYDVYRAVGGGMAVKVGSANTLSYGDTGLAANTLYSYYVVARDQAGNTSSRSNTVAAGTQTPPTPQETGSIRGNINHFFGRNQPGRVVIRVQGVKRIHNVNRNGGYAVNNVPIGTYKVRYQAPGFFSKEVTVKVNAGEVTTRNVNLRHR